MNYSHMRYAPLNAAFTRRRPIRRVIRVPPPSVAPIAPSTFISTPPPRYTTQQLITMRDRAAAAQDEFNAAQSREYGDGFEFDLEQIAAENNASDAAVDAGFDTTLPAVRKTPNVLPLMLAAAAAYFFL